jgi:hypothetical protein
MEIASDVDQPALHAMDSINAQIVRDLIIIIMEIVRFAQIHAPLALVHNYA